MKEHVLLLLLAAHLNSQCTRERCCLVSTCSLAYCTQKNS